ncbi:hypothetical protein [uncultured Treponema sp.]|uniref:hypothetical protein n=1 Tax=uncultured Treponema sp. TaxID=162155 RepID=UPI00262C245A|nr:hypothetical protein [uncultured Treponema sp.]
MYFSKKRKLLIAQVIKNSPDLLCRISLDAGWCGLQETVEMADIMFRAWRIWSNSRWSFFSKKYSGVLRKFHVDYDIDRGMCRPRFCLLVLAKPDNKIEEWRLRKKIYLSWYSAWSSAMRNSSDVSVNVEFLDKKNAVETIENFCNLNMFESSSVDNELIGIEKRIRQDHRTFSAGGIFRKALNRHVSVEEKNENNRK